MISDVRNICEIVKAVKKENHNTDLIHKNGTHTFIRVMNLFTNLTICYDLLNISLTITEVCLYMRVVQIIPGIFSLFVISTLAADTS
jgi:hypothetical protein